MYYHKNERYEMVKEVMKKNQHMYLWGDAGCGKSSTAVEACKDLKKLYERMSCKKNMLTSDFIGTWTVQAKDNVSETVWMDGVLTRCVRNGKTLIIDEIDYAQPAVLTQLNYVLENEGKLILSEKGGEVVKPKKGFHIIATGNTNGHGDRHGMYSGSQVLNEAFLDRFEWCFHFKYLNKSDETDILQKTFNKALDQEDCELLVDFAHKLRVKHSEKAIKSPFSTRRLVMFVGNLLTLMNDLKLSYEDAMRTAIDSTITNRMQERDVEKVQEIAQRILKIDFAKANNVWGEEDESSS